MQTAWCVKDPQDLAEVFNLFCSIVVHETLVAQSSFLTGRVSRAKIMSTKREVQSIREGVSFGEQLISSKNVCHLPDHSVHLN